MLYQIFIIIIFTINKFVSITDPDFFFHYETGKYILENGFIPKNDIFSWFETTTRWYTPSWLFDVITYKIGSIGLIVLTLISIILLILIISKIYFANDSKINIFKYLIFTLIIISMYPFIQHRPTIFSFLFFSYTILILFNYINEDKYKKLIYTLPIVQLLWVNLHGASSSLMYVLLGVILFLNIFKDFTFYKIKHERIEKTKIKVLIRILILVLLATLINPNTYEIFIFVFKNMNNSVIFNSISELQSPNFKTLFDVIIYFIPLCIFFLTFLFNKKDKYRLRDILIVFMFIYLYLSGIRFYPFLLILIAYSIKEYLWFPNINLVEINNKKIKYIMYPLFIVTTLSVFILKLNTNNPLKEAINTKEYYSEELISYLIKEEPKRLCNDFNNGSYLSYKFIEEKTNIKVFINGLAEIYSYTILEDSLDLYKLKGDPNDILNKYNFDYIVVNNTYQLYYYLKDNSNYKLIYEDKTGVIYMKVSEK